MQLVLTGSRKIFQLWIITEGRLSSKSTVLYLLTVFEILTQCLWMFIIITAWNRNAVLMKFDQQLWMHVFKEPTLIWESICSDLLPACFLNKRNQLFCHMLSLSIFGSSLSDNYSIHFQLHVRKDGCLSGNWF